MWKKYYIYKEQISYDGGQTWSDTGNQTISGDPIGEYETEEECEGGEPPTPPVPPTPSFDGKARLTMLDGSVVTIPGSGILTSEETSAYSTNTIMVEIGSACTGLGEYCFNAFNKMSGITIPNSVTSIGYDAFGHCSSLSSITIPNSVTSIERQAFACCRNLTSITIPSSVTSIDGCIFACTENVIASIVVDSGNTVYDSRNNCNAIIETSSNKLINGCKNTIIPNSVTSIGREAFHSCSALTSVNIPSSVTSIDVGAFQVCKGMKSVTIGSGVTSIGLAAFSNCSGLTSITIRATTPPRIDRCWGTNCYPFDNTNNCPIYVPAASVSAYKTATNWDNYKSRIVAIPQGG